MAAPDGSGPIFSGWELWYIVPVAFLVAVLAVGGMAVSTLSGTDRQRGGRGGDRRPAAVLDRQGGRHVLGHRAETGLSLAQLEAFNPRTNPTTIRPGQRIKLREKVPAQAPKPLGPKFWKVRHGQSFGSIAAATGKPIDTADRAQPAPEAGGAQARRPRAVAPLSARPGTRGARPRARHAPRSRHVLHELWIFFSVSRSSERSVPSRCASASATGPRLSLTSESVCAAPAAPVSSAARSSTASAKPSLRRLGCLVDLRFLVLCHGHLSVLGCVSPYPLAREPARGGGSLPRRRHLRGDLEPTRRAARRRRRRRRRSCPRQLAAEAQLERAAVGAADGDVAGADPAERLERRLHVGRRDVRGERPGLLPE